MAAYSAAAQPSHGGGSATSVASARPSGSRVAASSAAPKLELPKLLGQLLIGTYPGRTPPPSLLAAIQQGHIGAVILMGTNTAGGVRVIKAAVTRMQAAARRGGNSGLLIMTDQEGGVVKRLVGPPSSAAVGMANPATAYTQGRAAGRLLRSAGVNVDLAPVADVIRTNGFIEQEGRSFGSSPGVVSRAACGFAAGLAGSGVAYTLKHFPGLGDALATTDVKPVRVSEPASQIYADDAAYRRCGHSPMALVMISSASYTHLTGSVPAVLDPKIYSTVLPLDNVTALPISDSFEGGAIRALANEAPAQTAINAGLDMVMYSAYEADALRAYTALLADARAGSLSRTRVQAAATRVLQLKQKLDLTNG